VLNAAWDAGIQVASENALPCYDRDGYNKTLENAKPRNDPDGRHLFGFTYLRLCSVLFERPNFMEFERFVKRMHGRINRSLVTAAPQFTSCIYTAMFTVSFGVLRR
jgi:beta-amylase